MKKQIIFLLGITIALGGFTVLLACLSPAETVTAPENRDRMTDLAVVSKTGSQNIDSVSFKMGDTEYAMGEIGAHKSQSITLGQGTWEMNLKYTRKGIAKTCDSINSIIVLPDNFQALQECCLFFYLNKHGAYALSRTWPPFPNDADEQDILPPDAGYGRAIIKIVNNSYALAEKVTIQSLQNTGDFPLTLNYNQFSPCFPVQYNKTGYVEVTGTPEFPIEAQEYLVQISMENSEGIGIIERKVYIKDKVIIIVITGGDIMLQNS